MRRRNDWHEGSFTSFDGTTIYYEVGGNTECKRTLFFLHGLGGNLTAWDPQRTYYEKLGYTTIAIDLRGHGISGRPTNKRSYAMDNFSQDIYQLLNIYKIEKATLIGHCFGGMIALNFAGKFPTIMESLILVGTSYKPPFFSPLVEKSKVLLLLQYTLTKLPISFGKSGQPQLSQFIGTSNLNPKRIFSDIFYTTLPSYLGAFNALCAFNGYSLLEKITCPTLIIHGTEDSIFSPETALTLQQNITNAHLTFLPDANHILVINNPKELSTIIEKYLRRYVQQVSYLQHRANNLV